MNERKSLFALCLAFFLTGIGLNASSLAQSTGESPGNKKYRDHVERNQRANSDSPNDSLPTITPPTIEQMVAEPHDAQAILVKILPTTDTSEVFTDYSLTPDKALKLVPGLHRVKIPAGIAIQDLLEQLNADPRVAYAEPDYIVQPNSLRNDVNATGN